MKKIIVMGIMSMFLLTVLTSLTTVLAIESNLEEVSRQSYPANTDGEFVFVEEWNKIYHRYHNDEGFSVYPTNDGGYIIAAQSNQEGSQIGN